MKFSKTALLSAGLALLVVVSGFMFVMAKKGKVDAPKMASVDVQSKDGDNTMTVHYDIQMYDNLKYLYSNADYVVRGTANKKSDKTRNMAKD